MYINKYKQTILTKRVVGGFFKITQSKCGAHDPLLAEILKQLTFEWALPVAMTGTPKENGKLWRQNLRAKGIGRKPAKTARKTAKRNNALALLGIMLNTLLV